MISLKNEFSCYFFFLMLTISSGLLQSLQVLTSFWKKRVVMSINVYIYIDIYITQNIYVKYINNLFLNTHAKGMCLWWVVFKLYNLVHVS